MKRLGEIFDFILIGLVILIIGIPLLIFHILSYPSRRLEEKKSKRDYINYLHRIEGKNFFCYNNRKNVQELIETIIIPRLPKDVEIIFLNGKVIESDYAKTFMSRALYSLKNYQKFPHLMKIRNGEVLDFSLNNTFYNTINQQQPLDKLLAEINLFFDLEESKEIASQSSQ